MHLVANSFGRGTIKKAGALVLILTSLTLLCVNSSWIVEGQTGNSWVEKAPMPTARFSFGVLSMEKYALLGVPLTAHRRFLQSTRNTNPIADKWSEKSPMPTPSYGSATVAFENRI
jgi:hypothetical protein